MKFMTPASVKNLPQYLADDRRRSLLRKEEERYQEEKNSRKKFAEFTNKLQSVTANAQNRDELIKNYDLLKQEYAPYLEPEWMQIGANAVRQWQQDQYDREDRQQRNQDRNRKLSLENQAISDQNTLGKLMTQAGGNNLLSSGGEVYDVPVQKQTMINQLSGGGLLKYREMMDQQAAKEQDAKRNALLNRKTQMEIDQMGRPKFNTKTLYNKNGDQWKVYTPAMEAEAIKQGFGYVQPARQSGGSGGQSLSDFERLEGMIQKDLLQANRLRQDPQFGLVNLNNEPVPEKEAVRLRDTADFIMDMTQNKISSGMGEVKAYREATKEYNQAVTDVANAISVGLEAQNLEGLQEIPMVLQADAVLALSRQTGVPAKQIRQQISSILAGSDTVEDNDNTNTETNTDNPPPKPSIGTGISPSNVGLPDSKAYGMKVERSGNSPLSMFQKALSDLPVYQGQKDTYPLPGETEIEMAIRLAYGEGKYPLQERKRMADLQRKRYPNATDEQIAQAILKGAKKAHETGDLDDWANFLLEKK